MLGEAQWQSVGFQYQYDLGDLELGKALKPKNLKTKKKKKDKTKHPNKQKAKTRPNLAIINQMPFSSLKKKNENSIKEVKSSRKVKVLVT